jgi:hypothetical protein
MARRGGESSDLETWLKAQRHRSWDADSRCTNMIGCTVQTFSFIRSLQIRARRSRCPRVQVWRFGCGAMVSASCGWAEKFGRSWRR